eukprot:scaffold157_cov24-Tisochrysis_lutea.AAC.4
MIEGARIGLVPLCRSLAGCSLKITQEHERGPALVVRVDLRAEVVGRVAGVCGDPARRRHDEFGRRLRAWAAQARRDAGRL